MVPTVWTYLIVCPLVFLAGFVDSVAGGGGVISLPAYLLAGLPPKLAAGTNKLANGCGTALSVFQYGRSGKIEWNCALPAAFGCLLGATGGTQLAVSLPDEVLKIVILAALPVAAVILVTVRKRTDADEKVLSREMIGLLSLLIGLLIGVYDGLIGPGTGTFLTIAFSVVLGFGLLKSAGCARTANLASNVASLIIYLLNGDVLFSVGIPAIACSMLGNFFGARYAIKGGSRKIRYVMFFVLGLLFLKTVLELTGVIRF
ncbi:MAG: sulfite exporter TauE/SafE family protein [Clostridia bacterium]|nr:sulfite exporter TauE/SafE family protein [Clostridia bacterium]